MSSSDTQKLANQPDYSEPIRLWSLGQVVEYILCESGSESARAAACKFGLTRLALAMELAAELSDCNGLDFTVIRRLVQKAGIAKVKDFINVRCTTVGFCGPAGVNYVDSDKANGVTSENTPADGVTAAKPPVCRQGKCVSRLKFELKTNIGYTSVLVYCAVCGKMYTGMHRRVARPHVRTSSAGHDKVVDTVYIKNVQKYSRALGVSVSPCHIDRDKLRVVLAADMKLPEDFELKFIQPKFWRSVGSESGCTGVVAGQ